MTPLPAEPAFRTRSTPSNRLRIAQVLLIVVGGILLAYPMFVLANRCCGAIRFPYELEYGEGGVLLEAANTAHGHAVYNDYRQYPFVAATYPPVYPLLCALGVKAFGVQFAFGRVLSVFAMLGVAALIWIMLRRARASRLSAAVAAALFLAAPIVRWWAPVARVDMLALLFGMAGLYAVLRGGRWLLLAAGLLVLAAYTKQSLLAPVVASVVYLWWTRGRKAGLGFAAGWGILVLAIFAALQTASAGWFYRHIIVSNENRWDPALLGLFWKTAFVGWPLPFVLGLVGVGIAFSASDSSDGTNRGAATRPERLFALYLLASLLTSLSAGKVGAHVNYMLEPLAASCIAAGMGYDYIAKRLPSRRAILAWAATWAALIASLAVPLFRPAALPEAAAARQRGLEQGRLAVDLIRNARGDVLSEVVGLTVLAGRRVMLEPFEFTQMFLDGHWDQRQFLRDIERRRFALIILAWDPRVGISDSDPAVPRRWSRGMERAIMRNYRLGEKLGSLYVAVPDHARPQPGDLSSSGSAPAAKPSGRILSER